METNKRREIELQDLGRKGKQTTTQLKIGRKKKKKFEYRSDCYDPSDKSLKNHIMLAPNEVNSKKGKKYSSNSQCTEPYTLANGIFVYD